MTDSRLREHALTHTAFWQCPGFPPGSLIYTPAANSGSAYSHDAVYQIVTSVKSTETVDIILKNVSNQYYYSSCLKACQHLLA